MSGSVLEVAGLGVRFPARAWSGRAPVRALSGVDLRVADGEVVGLVGESGSGKTTLARVVLGLQRASEGRAWFRGRELPVRGGRYPRDVRRHLQVVLQDPYASLNPAMDVEDLVGEGAGLHLGLRGRARRARVLDLLAQVGLPADLAARYPRDLSGGQRQRVALARALATRPELLVLDEPVSSVDVSTREQIVDLLERLRAEHGLSYLMIAHDLGLVRRTCRRAVVLYRGELMEAGPSEVLWAAPRHPYTQALLAAVPVPDPAVQAARRAAREAAREAALPPAPPAPQAAAARDRPDEGCVFRQRCPRRSPVCETRPPTSLVGDVTVRCHHPLVPAAGTAHRPADPDLNGGRS
ncbi:MAG: oligopeptide/dipeptide ABC transporter ATP-binding protein [Kineosporiaceae bacterium]